MGSRRGNARSAAPQPATARAKNSGVQRVMSVVPPLLETRDPERKAQRIDLRAVLEGLRPETEDDLEAAVGGAVALDAHGAGEAQQPRVEPLQVVAEDVAHRPLQRPRDPGPDGPFVTEGGDGGAP